MATVIDALVVTLGLNAQNFTQGNREANQSLDRTRQNTKDVTKEEDKREKQQERTRKARNRDHIEQRKQQKESIDNFKEMTKQAVSFFGFATTFGGMVSWIGGITQANSQLYRASNNLGTGVESLKEWGMAIEQTGGDAKSAVSTMQMLSKMMTEIKYGILPANMGLFSALGVDLFKASQAGEPLVEVLKMINKGAQGIKEKNGIRDAINSIQMLGIDYDMANLLAKDEKTLNAFLASADKINKLNQSGAENSAKLAQQWVILKQKGEALGQTIEEKVTPKIFDFIKGLEKLVEENPKAVAAVGILAGAFLLKFSPVRAVLLGISGLLVADDWVTWANKGESQIGRLIAAAKQFWYTFNGAFDEKSKNELDKKTIGVFSRSLQYLKNIDDPDSKDWFSQLIQSRKELGFKLEDGSKVKKRTNVKQYKSDLIKQGYSEQNAQARIDFLKENGAIGEDGYIKNNVNLNLKSPKEEATNELRNNVNLNLKSPKEEATNELRNNVNLNLKSPKEEATNELRNNVNLNLKSPKEEATNELRNNVNLNLKSPKEEATNELRNKREMQNRNFNAQRAAANPSGYNNTQSSSTTTNSTNVGQVIINTQASDARGVYNEFVNRVLVNQAESGGF